MVSLARASLRYEWRRFLPAVLAVGFSGLLIMVSGGLMLGIFSAMCSFINFSGAELWVGFRDTPSFDQARLIPARLETEIRMHPEVMRVEPFLFGGGDWRRPDGQMVSVLLVGVDTSDDALMLKRALSPALRRAIEMPDAVLVDAAELAKLGVKLGDEAELAGKRVKVAGVTHGLRALGGANVIASVQTTRRISPWLRIFDDQTAYFLVGLRDPTRAEVVRDALQPRGSFRPFSVWTSQEFADKTERYWIFESGAGAGFLFSTLIGIVIGIAITAQTLSAAINASLREYATLRALGVSLRKLRWVVFEQAAWIGAAGFVFALLATAAVVALARASDTAIKLPPNLVVATGVLLMGASIGAGVFALRILARSEPASLLR